MANFKQIHTAIAIYAQRGSQLARRLISLTLRLFCLSCGLTLVILIIVRYHISRKQGDLGPEDFSDLDSEDSATETSEDDQGSEPAASTPALNRPTLQRRNCFIPGLNWLKSQPPSLDSLPVSSCLSAYTIALAHVAPASIMAQTAALSYSEDSVSSQTRAPTTLQAALTGEQITAHSDTSSSNSEEEAEMIRRRNIKMREEGVPVNVKYSQLAAPTWKLAPAPGSQPTQGTISTGSSSPGAHTPSTSSQSSSSSTNQFLSGLQSPAPTPCSDTVLTTPDLQQQRASILPPGGTAGGILDTLHEKLLAVPADAVSRRLLIDGRAVLHGRKRTPRCATPRSSGTSFVYGHGNSGEVPISVRSSKSRVGYPSDLME